MPRAQTAASGNWDWSGRATLRDGDAVLPFALRPREIFVDEDDEVRGFGVEFAWPGRDPRRVDIPASVLRAARPADAIAEAGGSDITGKAARIVVELLDEVRLEPELLGIPVQHVVTRAAWLGDVLNVPGDRPAAGWKPELAAYGQVSDRAEEDARKDWREIVETAAGWPRALVAYGMPIGSVYGSRLRFDSFALHITGESHSGKTETAEIAMSAFSSAERPHGAMYRTWDASAQAPANLLKLTGPLPVWFDETAAFGGDETEFTKVIFKLSQGRGRIVADTEGGLRAGSGERWDASVISTGEARISNRSGLTGLRRRVVELHAPVMKDAGGEEQHGAVLVLARRSYGWPIRWLTDDPRPDETEQLFAYFHGELSRDARNTQIEAATAANLAVCLTGFATLVRLSGASISSAKITAQGRKVFEKLLNAADEEGADIGERGLRAMKEAVQRNMTRFIAPEDSLGAIERWGILFSDGYVGIVGETTLAQILDQYAGLPDPQPVLERWAGMGILKRDGGKYTGRRSVYVPGAGMKTSRLYLVKVR